MLSWESLIAQLLPVNNDRLAVKKNEGNPRPLVRRISPKVVGASLDASVTRTQRRLVARIKLELHLAEDDNAIIERLGAMHGAARVGR